MNDPLYAAVICAAGNSSRMGGIKKEYHPLPAKAGLPKGRPDETVLGAAVTAFTAADRIGLIVIVFPPAENGEAEARAALPAGLLADGSRPRLLFAAGGKTRRASVHHALTLLSAHKPDYVLIHDGARPWVDAALVNRIIDAVAIHTAVIPVLPLTETPKEIEKSDGKPGGAGCPAAAVFVKRHLRRPAVVTAQTPQAFAFPEILHAHEKAAEKEQTEGVEFTDDAEIWGEFCGPVAVIPGAPENRKITFPEDLNSII
ncbi:MAG: 2-C-methyl-D-erythritol 4-phosphate cytidylyltransferase [Treponema sp.]|jgi:2-C-methyl-D-erythritol 4-phosphate cytidylyltransferase|nr:2-C-methyl-D-erythritol 4-phosphate cytidylyltransferase [Treponema sp.]